MYEAIGITLSVAVGLAIAVWVLIGLTSLYAEVGLIIVVADAFLYACFPDLPAMRLGLTVHMSDVFYGLILGGAGMRSLRRGALARIPWPMMGFFFMMVLSLVIGVAQSGVGGAMEARGAFYLAITIYYFLTFDVDRGFVRRAANIWLVGAVLLVGLCVYRWTNMLLDIDDYAWLDNTGIKGRVLPGTYALMLGQGLAVILFAFTRGVGARGWIFFFPVLLATIIGAQQRTVWLCTVLGIFLVFGRARGGRGKLLATAGAVAVLAASVALPFLSSGKGEQVAQEISKTAEAGSATSGGTFGARVGSWGSFMTEYAKAGPIYQVIGKPFGSSYELHFDTGARQTFSVHNDYLQRLQHMGILGLLAWLAYFVWSFRRLLRGAREELGAEADLLIVMLAIQLVFSITYGLPPQQGVWLGLAGALCRPLLMRRAGRRGRVAPA